MLLDESTGRTAETTTPTTSPNSTGKKSSSVLWGAILAGSTAIGIAILKAVKREPDGLDKGLAGLTIIGVAIGTYFYTVRTAELEACRAKAQSSERRAGNFRLGLKFTEDGLTCVV
jgi:hypothetical protein